MALVKGPSPSRGRGQVRVSQVRSSPPSPSLSPQFGGRGIRSAERRQALTVSSGPTYVHRSAVRAAVSLQLTGERVRCPTFYDSPLRKTALLRSGMHIEWTQPFIRRRGTSLLIVAG